MFSEPKPEASKNILLVMRDNCLKNYLKKELESWRYSVETQDNPNELIEDLAGGIEYKVLVVELNGDIKRLKEKAIRISQTANPSAGVISFSERNYFPRTSDLHLRSPTKEQLREVLLRYLQ